jgi:ATP-dependent DNA ligase
LLSRSEWPYFLAFDLLRLEGLDLCKKPLVQRKRMLRSVKPKIDSRLQYVDGIDERGEDFFHVVCDYALEGIVAKRKQAIYHTDGLHTNWLTIKNPNYSQMAGRDDLFEARDKFRGDIRQPPDCCCLRPIMN